MAFEISNFNVAKKLVLEKSEFTVECNISLGDNAQKILASSVEAGVSGSEALNGVANYSGTVDIKIVFLNNEGEINTVCSTCPFSSKFENEDIVTGQKPLIKVKVVDYTIDSVSGDSARVSVMLMQSGFILSNKEVRTISNGNDDVCCKFDEIDIVKFLGSLQETFEVESEISLRDKIKKILLTESRVLVRNAESGVNFVTVSGDVIIKVLYINENDKFENGYLYDTFKEEIDLEGVTRDCFVEASAHIKQENMVTELISDEKGERIAVKTPITINVCAYAPERLQVIKDLYSTKRELNTTTQSFEMAKANPVEVIEGKIEGSLMLGEDSPRVDKILFFGGDGVSITNQYINENEIFVEGIARTNVVYLNDEDGLWYSVQLDVPFTISDKTNINPQSVLSVDATVSDVDVSVKKGRELLYDAKVKASINYTTIENSAVISEAVEKDEYPEKDCAMEVVFAKAGQELWDIAKDAKVKESQIVSQNPDITFPLENDNSLILFYQKLN